MVNLSKPDLNTLNSPIIISYINSFEELLSGVCQVVCSDQNWMSPHWFLAVQTRVWQFNRWHCHSVTESHFWFLNLWQAIGCQIVTQEIWDLWDIWPQWWADMVWPIKRHSQRYDLCTLVKLLTFQIIDFNSWQSEWYDNWECHWTAFTILARF